jgi:hypothetical protein
LIRDCHARIIGTRFFHIEEIGESNKQGKYV